MDQHYKRVCVDIWGCIPTDVEWAKGTDLYVQKLEDELEQAEEEDNERFRKAPIDMSYDEFVKYMEPTSRKVAEASRRYRMVQKPKFSELSNFGHMMPLKEFIVACENKLFINYDGFGRYVRDGLESDIDIYPSDTYHKSIRKDFDTIIWFNK